MTEKILNLQTIERLRSLERPEILDETTIDVIGELILAEIVHSIDSQVEGTMVQLRIDPESGQDDVLFVEAIMDDGRSIGVNINLGMEGDDDDEVETQED